MQESRRRNSLWLYGLSIVVGVAAAVALFEAGGRVFLWMAPSYDVVFLEPDPIVGWKQLPGHAYTWAGPGWFARDYSVQVRTNAEGFRDREHPLTKPPGTERIALLGDSFVEAIQVPLDQTAAQLLEARLNARASDRNRDVRFEVLNFGISNYGVGQYLLAWEAYARRFAPDVVFVLLADFHLLRTVRRYETGAFRSTRGMPLWARPTFRLEHGSLL